MRTFLPPLCFPRQYFRDIAEEENVFIAEVFGANYSSNTSHARSFPSISKSFISKPPPGFVDVIRLARNFFDYSKRQFLVPVHLFLVALPIPFLLLVHVHLPLD